ncbi:MAG: hypothetical protein AAFQ84_12345, partial [Pseudomonadota bacterium]
GTAHVDHPGGARRLQPQQDVGGVDRPRRAKPLVAGGPIALARRQGAWAVRGAEGQILKRGHDLGPVLKVFERHKLKIVT